MKHAQDPVYHYHASRLPLFMQQYPMTVFGMPSCDFVVFSELLAELRSALAGLVPAKTGLTIIDVKGIAALRQPQPVVVIEGKIERLIRIACLFHQISPPEDGHLADEVFSQQARE